MKDQTKLAFGVAPACVLGYAFSDTTGGNEPPSVGGALDPRTCGEDTPLPHNTEPAQVSARHNQPAFRRAVLQRDNGVCAACGLSTLLIYEEIENLWYEVKKGANAQVYLDTLRHYGAEPILDWPPTLWEADHVVPLSEGGANDLTNAQTLCLLCHRAKTTAENIRRFCDHPAFEDHGACTVCGVEWQRRNDEGAPL